MQRLQATFLSFLFALSALAVPADAASSTFGASGTPAFQEYIVEGVSSAPEPTVGIPWNTDSLFYHSGSTTIKGTFDDNGSVTWTDVTPLYQVPINVDPLLVVDEDSGRIFAGGLHGPCSVMMYSDDDGATWLPTGNMCNGAQFDHQSLGIGPSPLGHSGDTPQLQWGYYCGQNGLIGCSVSFDGGVTWFIPTPNVADNLLGAGCGGFHGHWRISRVTGTAFLPVGDCGENRGLLVPNILGLDGTEPVDLLTITWEGRTVEGSHPWVAGFDPSIGISRDSGWLYYGDADHKGAFMALSKDEGRSWESLPAADGANTTWVDVGAFHDPPIVAATFADVQAGDDDRAAFTFLGIEEYDGIDLEYVQSDLIFSCEERQDELVWYYYAAFTYDAGQTWEVTRLTDDPVQVGGIYDSLGDHVGGCRNLLDFNDMDIDSKGRVHIGYADGCVGACDTEQSVESDGALSQEPRVLRQATGRGLFAAHDVDAPAAVLDSDNDGIPDDEDDTPFGEPDDEEGSPFVGIAVLAGLLAAVALVRRRD